MSTVTRRRHRFGRLGQIQQRVGDQRVEQVARFVARRLVPRRSPPFPAPAPVQAQTAAKLDVGYKLGGEETHEFYGQVKS